MKKPLKLELSEGYSQKSYRQLTEMEPPVSASDRIFPIRHETLIGYVMDAIYEDGLSVGSAFYAVSASEKRFLGIVEVVSDGQAEDEDSWVIAFTNANDGTDGVSIYGGCRIYASNTLAFHEELSVLVRHTEESLVALPSAIRKAVKSLHGHWNILEERREAYKQVSLTIERTHHYICETIWNEYVAGREVNAILHLWHTTVHPKNLWALYECLCQILNKLRPSQLIDRTKSLTLHFDFLAKFQNKPSPYTQTKLQL